MGFVIFVIWLMTILVSACFWLLAKELERLGEIIKHINGHVCDCIDDEPEDADT